MRKIYLLIAMVSVFFIGDSLARSMDDLLSRPVSGVKPDALGVFKIARLDDERFDFQGQGLLAESRDFVTLSSIRSPVLLNDPQKNVGRVGSPHFNDWLVSIIDGVERHDVKNPEATIIVNDAPILPLNVAEDTQRLGEVPLWKGQSFLSLNTATIGERQ